MQTASGPHPRTAFRDKYLAAVGIVALLLCSILGRAQIIQYPNPGAYGQGMHRFVPDSVLYFPTGCGAPSGIASLNSYGFTGLGQKIRQAAIYADTCGKHVYWFNWTDSSWRKLDTVGGGGGGGGGCAGCSADSLWNVKIDTAGMSDTTRYLYYDLTSNTYKFRKMSVADIVNALGYTPSRIIQDILGNRPVSSTTGTFFFATDTKVLYRWNGSAWDPLTVLDNAITNAKLAQMPTNTIKGNSSGSTANAQDLTVSQVQTMLNVKLAGDSSTNTGSYTTRGWLYHVLDSLNALADTTDYHSAGSSGLDILKVVISGRHATIIFPKVRDSTRTAIAADSALTIATYDSTSANRLATGYDVDTAKANLRSSIAAAAAPQDLETTLNTGSTISTSHIIAEGSNTLSITHTGGNVPLTVTSNSNTAVRGVSTSSTGIQGESNTGYGGYFQNTPTTTNTTEYVAGFARRTSGTGANGIAGALTLEAQDNTAVRRANSLIWKWTNATDGSRVSEFSITGVNAGTEATIFTLSGNGTTKLNTYGLGSHTGTAAYGLSVDASGNIIETTAGGGGITQIKAKGIANALGTDTVNVGRRAADSSVLEDQIGYIYSNNNFTAVSPLVTAGSITVTASGGALHFSGGANNLSQYLYYDWPSLLERWTMIDSIVVQSKSSTSYGFAMGLLSSNTSGPQSAVFQFDMTTGTNSGKTTLWNGVYYTPSSAISFSVGDTIRMAIYRNVDTLTCITTNVTQKLASVNKVIFDFTNLPYLHNTGRPTIFSVGGNFDLIGWNYFSSEAKNAPVVLIGNSKGQGSFASNKYKRFASLMNNRWRNTVNHSGGNDRIVEAQSAMSEFALLRGKQAVLDIMRNSLATVDTTTVFTQYAQLAKSLDSLGYRVIHLTPQWEALNNFTFATTLNAARNWLYRNYPASNIIDCYTAIQKCGMACLYTDSVHLSDMGNAVMDTTIRQAHTIWYGDNKTNLPEARNGLKVKNNNTVLGQDFWETGDPAKLYGNSEIPLNSFTLRLRGTNDSVDVTNTGDIKMTGGLYLPSTSGSKGVIFMNNARFLHSTASITNLFGGTNSGNLSVTGLNNTGYGYNTLFGATSGHDNTAVGTVCMQNVSTGTQNTGMGVNSGFWFTGNTGNSLFGYNVMGAVTSSSANNNSIVGNVGFQSGTTGGSANSGIGDHVLYQCNGCSGNTALGRYAGGSSTSATNNKLFISAYGDGSAGHSIGDNIMFGDLATLRVGFGNNNSPAHTIDVTGDLRTSDTVEIDNIRDGNGADSMAVLRQLSAGKFVIRKIAPIVATSGIYLPTITNVSNAGSITSDSAVWDRNDNTVTVSGHFQVTPTSGSVNTQVAITVPVNSQLAGFHAAWGTSMTSQTTNNGVGGVIIATAANKVQVTFYPTGWTSATDVYYTYQYRVQ